MDAEYLYRPAEFPLPPVAVNSITLLFDFQEDTVTVTAETKFTVLQNPVAELKLNAKNLEILTVVQDGIRPVKYTYADDILTLKLRSTQKPGSSFRITTKTVCRPTANILEGLYYDITPEGKPRTVISQCQQWGFQRIAPCIDDMRTKCTWKTTIIADSRYTNLISNGNISIPRTKYDRTRDSITYENKEPMPPYLFFIGVGTWDTFSRDFVYPDGKTVRLELLALPGSNPENAGTAVDIMADAILWTHIFTGPEKYESLDKRQRLYELCTERYRNGETAELAEEIRELSRKLVMGYQYPYEVYREIAMQNSDFGGMENTGNTTIIANRIMPDSEITDASYEYLFGVKQHEFYHNLNGSGVTGDTPFSIWLNEAVTVMMEDDYLAFHFGTGYQRLNNLMQIYTPGSGTFSLDTGSISMPIEPDGFNDPNDLITSVTYVKAPEFTRMIETSLGKPAFAWALDLYHRKYAGSNASPSDWLRVMEEVGKTDFSIMASRWLKETGYPVVSAAYEWDSELHTAIITVTQKGFKPGKPWIFPFTGKLIGENGDVLSEFQQKIDAETITFSVPCSRPVSFALWNTNHAAYIRMERDESDDLLYRELTYDSNPVSKFLTFVTLYEREMIRLLEDETAVPSEVFGDAFMQMLEDKELTSSCGSLPFTMFEAVSDTRFEYAHTALYQAKQKILRSIAGRYEVRLRLLYEGIPDAVPEGFVPKELAAQFKQNAVRNLILTVLSSLDTPDTQFLAKHQFTSAKSSTNRLAALTLFLSSSAFGRMDIVEEELKRTAGNPIAFENFIAAVAGSFSPDTVRYLKLIEASPFFHREQSGESRSLYLRFSQNRKLSIETDEGRKFLEASIISMAGVNSYLTTGMLSVFSYMNQYNNLLRTELYTMLKRIETSISPAVSPAVYQTVKQLLSKAFGNE